MVTQALSVSYAGLEVGAAAFDTKRQLGTFQYAPGFIAQGLELAPLMMPLSSQLYTFPALSPATFRGLPGLLADSLPDDFGNAVLNAWVARQGKNVAAITPLERLQYAGKRGMGALEFHPALRQKGLAASQQLEIKALVGMAQEVLDSRQHFEAHLAHSASSNLEAMRQLLQVGMSAGGARPKAVLAFNHDFSIARSGQVDAPAGFTHYLMKFDGVTEHSAGAENFGDPLGYGAMEYVYHLMALKAGIQMEPCYLFSEGARRHFLARRFDRDGNAKRHVQTLNGIAHVDYRQPGSFSYEELFDVARRLALPLADAKQILKRLLFNIVARNHDDHAKNWAFCMNREGKWSLAPAYDLAYSYKPGSPWVGNHWMSLNGKRDAFTRDDLYAISRVVHAFNKRAIQATLDEVLAAVSLWPQLAREHEVPAALINEVQRHLRLAWSSHQ